MENQMLKAEARKTAGSREAARLRKAGQVPGIVYGHKQTPAAIAVDPKQLERQIAAGGHLFTLDLSGKRETCLLKDVQYDALGLHPVHVDFVRVDLNEKVKVKVPLELRGPAKGQAEGGVVSQMMMDLEVECLVSSIPGSIRVSITELGLNQMLHVRELPLPSGVRALADAEVIVAMCREPLAVAETPVAAAEGVTATEPEVIAKGKLPEEGEAGATEEKPKK
ncbi:MAG: 50S ribosomal protein L25 [Phycisphaerae bacterium]